ALVLPGIGRAVGADLAGTPLDAVAERLGDERGLLVLDNLEQGGGAAADMGRLLTRCPGGGIFATSRTALGLRARPGNPWAGGPNGNPRCSRCRSARRPILPP